MQFFTVISNLLTLKDFVIWIGGLVVALGTVGAAWSVLSPQSPVPNAAAILRSIQDTALLVTEIAFYDVHVKSGIIDGFAGANTYSGEFRGTGEIHAGIDLTDMAEGDIVFKNGTFEITVPAPKFTTCILTDFRQTWQSLVLFQPDWNRLREFASVDAYNAMTYQGVIGGLLDLAEQKAGDIISDIVHNTTGLDVILHFSEAGRGDKSDPRCTPAFPPGWGKEDASYFWVRLPS
ncbi:MAG: DUF4230 domain-containing protein [Anaerolineaceae bacterium]|nr:DUF4230 domain-containing protein [Anaerolineaceae bacterium]